MKKIIPFTLLLLIAGLPVLAQEEEYKEASKESQAYHKYRMFNAQPPYGLNKIKPQLKSLQLNDEDMTEALSAKTYQQLSLREKFTYHMIHGEVFSQICDVIPQIQDEQKKIMGYLPETFDEYHWSDRQLKFMVANRDSVLALIRSGIAVDKRIGLNYKLNATEMIPLLISTYNIQKKDHDILTVLMLLMEKNKYPAFFTSISHTKLYSKERDYYHEAFLVYNKPNEDLIIKRATDFYNGLRH
jgi:hypothetical protein